MSLSAKRPEPCRRGGRTDATYVSDSSFSQSWESVSYGSTAGTASSTPSAGSVRFAAPAYQKLAEKTTLKSEVKITASSVVKDRSSKISANRLASKSEKSHEGNSVKKELSKGSVVENNRSNRTTPNLNPQLNKLGIFVPQMGLPMSYGNLGEVTEYPDKDLYWHYNIGSQIYSKKVFVGGLPIDINEAEIQGIFGRFGKMFVDWPYKQNPLRFNYPNKSTGYVFLIYENEESVHTLVKHCSREGRHRLYLTVSSPTMKDKPVQVRPWRIADADFLDLNQFEPLNPKNTVFVGAVPRPMKSVELAHSMNETYGSVAYAGIDTDAEYYYPKGSGRVVFNCQQSYLTAISQRYVQLKIGEIDKRVEVKPYVMEGQACSVCKGSRSGSSDAPYFCAQVPCLDYFCEQCWADAHSVNNVSHQPFVKDTNTRNRTRY